MKFRQLSSNGDWTFGAGYNNYVTYADAIKLNVQTRLLSWQNNCFFDLNAGLPWDQFLGFKSQNSSPSGGTPSGGAGGAPSNKNNSQDSLDSFIKTSISSIILQTDGVIGISSLSTKISPDRSLTIRASVDSIYDPFDFTLTPTLPITQ